MSGDPGQEWQAYWDDGSSDDYLVRYDESDVFNLRPGRGFWLTSRQSWTVSDSIETVSLGDDRAAAIPLHEGWNIISNPFGEDVSWGQVDAAHRDSLRALWRFDGSFAQADTFRSARAGEAFYFLNDTGLDSLQIPYPSGSEVKTETKSREGSSLLTISARPEGSEGPASTVKIGFDEAAGEGLGRLDQPAPPGQFSSVSLRLSAPGEAPARQRLLMTERRPPKAGTDGGHTFEIRLRAETQGPVQITVRGLDATEGSEVKLLHPSAGRSYDLDSENTVTLQSADSTALRLAVGSAAYVQKQADKIAPDKVTLTSYPNPMHRQATLEYTLPKAKEVRLAVYDVLGRRVALLQKGRKQAGRHMVTLEGEKLPSGVYFGRLRAGDQTRTQKITVVR